ncbi:hypothetical protein ACFRQM_04910 [Streptomyces sp. NPDC056831]
MRDDLGVRGGDGLSESDSVEAKFFAVFAGVGIFRRSGTALLVG